MWRGCLSSFRYSVICLSESWRPNQVLHQNRKGMSTISQATRKKSNRLRVDMRCRGGGTESWTMAGGFAASEVGGRLAICALVLDITPSSRAKGSSMMLPCFFLGSHDHDTPGKHSERRCRRG